MFFEDYPHVTPLKERTTLEEDDVTYITIHNILRLNGYKIIAVSHLGAQADRVILIEPFRTGRLPAHRKTRVVSLEKRCKKKSMRCPNIKEIKIMSRRGKENR